MIKLRMFCLAGERQSADYSGPAAEINRPYQKGISTEVFQVSVDQPPVDRRGGDVAHLNAADRIDRAGEGDAPGGQDATCASSGDRLGLPRNHLAAGSSILAHG